MGELVRKSGQTLWLQVGEAIGAGIASGEWRPGERLPPEPALMARFGVGRHTVRQAMAMLEHRGVVRIEQGRGTFAHDGVVDYALSSRTRFSQNLLEQGREPSARSLGASELRAPEHVARHLNLRRGARVYSIVRLSSADGVVLSVGEVFYPARRFPGMPEKRRRRSDVTSVYAEYGITDYVRLQTFITAREATPEEARLLRQPRSAPVIVTRKVDADLAGVPIAYAETVWAAERVQFSIDNSRREPARRRKRSRQPAG